MPTSTKLWVGPDESRYYWEELSRDCFAKGIELSNLEDTNLTSQLEDDKSIKKIMVWVNIENFAGNLCYQQNPSTVGL